MIHQHIVLLVFVIPKSWKQFYIKYESQIVWKEKFQNIKLVHCSFTVKHSRFIKFLFKFHTWVLHSYMTNWPINSNDTLHPLQLDLLIQSKKEAGCPAAPQSWLEESWHQLQTLISKGGHLPLVHRHRTSSLTRLFSVA